MYQMIKFILAVLFLACLYYGAKEHGFPVEEMREACIDLIKNTYASTKVYLTEFYADFKAWLP